MTDPAHSVRLGVFLLGARFPGMDDGDALRTAYEAALAAERAGFDDVWLAEHHFMSYGTCPSAVTMAGHILGATERVRVGTAVSVLSSWHPVALAEQTALLDQLSGGRFTLGVGRGGPWIDLEVFGTGLDRYEHGFPEALDLLLGALTDGRAAGTGERFRFREVAVVPRARSRPRPPVVVACTSAGTLELAADRGLPMLLGLDVDDARRAAFTRHYAARAGRPGAAPPGHVAAAVGHVADSTAGAVAELRAALPRWLGPGLAGYRPVDDRPRRPRDPVDYAEHLCRIHPVGAADLCVRRLVDTFAATGVRQVMLMVEGCGERERVLENVARLGAEVLPRVRAHFG